MAQTGWAARRGARWAGPFPCGLPPNRTGPFPSIRLSSDHAVAENTEHRFGALHFAYLPVSLVSESPVPLRPAIGVTVSLAGRDSGDYYGHSVTAGLASRPVIPRSSLPYVVSVR